MKNFTKYLSVFIGALFFVSQVLAQPGNLLSNFGNSGVVTSAGNFDPDLASVTVDGQNRIILAGTTNGDMYVRRFSANGQPDLTFGTTGVVTINIGINDAAEDVITQSDNKILVAGSTDTINAAEGIILRLNTNGSLDNTFGVNGVFTFTGVDVFDRFREIALLSDGNIIGLLGIGAGSSSASSEDNYENVGLVKVKGNGTLDNTFAGTGLWRTTWLDLAWDRSPDLIIQPDDKILLPVGFSQAGQGRRVHAWRFDENGVQDNSFGEFSGQTDWYYLGNSASSLTSGVGVQSNGKILIAGTYGGFVLPEQDFFVWRLNANGIPDSTFNSEAFVTSDFFGEDDEATDLIMDGDNFLVVGTAYSGGQKGMAIARYLSDGSLDTSFGTGGKAFFNQGSTEGGFREGTLLPNGNLVATGVINGELAVLGIDNGGTTSIFSPGIPEIEARLFPNPVIEAAKLVYSFDETRDLSLSIYDPAGRLVKVILNNEIRPSGENSEEIECPVGLYSGWYTLRLRTKDGVATIPFYHFR